MKYIGFDGKVRERVDYIEWIHSKTMELTPCRVCHAIPGKPCQRPSGKRLGYLHVKRYVDFRHFFSMYQKKPHVFFYNTRWWCTFRGFRVFSDSPENALIKMKQSEAYHLQLHNGLNHHSELLLLKPEGDHWWKYTTTKRA